MTKFFKAFGDIITGSYHNIHLLLKYSLRKRRGVEQKMVERITNGDFSLTVADGAPAGGSTGLDPASWVVVEPGDTAVAEAADDIVQIGGGALVFSGGDTPTTGSVEQTVTGLPIGKSATFSADYGENGGGQDVSVLFEVIDGSGTVVFSQTATTTSTVSFSFTTAASTYTIRITDNSPTAGIDRDATVDNVSFDVACFASGTLIGTPNGSIPIESLEIGQLVNTADHGPQPIRWIGSNKLDADTLSQRQNLLPILIPAGALGLDSPKTNLIVSPQHRILLKSRIAERIFDCREVFVAAKKLVGQSGIRIMDEITQIAYYHLLFDNHEVVWSNGAQSESLFTGPMALNTLGQDAISELKLLFPQLDLTGETSLPARLIPRGKNLIGLLERHSRNLQPLVLTD